MKKPAVILLSLFTLAFINPGNEKHSYKNKDLSCTYETTQGRLNGQYVSFYANGKEKAEGAFLNNYRTGTWTVWDSTGRLRMQREYTDPFTFKRIIPPVPADAPVQLLNVPQYTIKYNKDGFIPYFNLQQRMVRWEKVIWRKITPAENPILFNKQLLFTLIARNINTKNVMAFDRGDDDSWQKKDSTTINPLNYKIIAFKIEEDPFFDDERLVTETRIIGLQPVVVDKQTNDTVELGWVYFPYFRKYLAQVKIQDNQLPPNIKTLDDLFFYRYFHGEIYRESNVYNRKISDYNKGDEIAKEAERIEIRMIEAEHDFWISLTE